MSIQRSASPPLARSSSRTAPAWSGSFPQACALMLGDAGSVLLAHLLTTGVFTSTAYAHVGLKATLVWLGVWVLWRAYQGLYPGYGRSPQTELRLHTIGTLQIAVVQIAAAFALPRFAPSAMGVAAEWALVLPLALFVRYAVRAALVRAGHYGRAVSVIGAGRTASITIAHLQAHPSYGLKPVAAYDDNPALHGRRIHGVPVMGSIDLALAEPRTEQAIISIPGARAETQKRIVNSVYGVFPITWVIPDLFGVPNQALHPHNIGSLAGVEIRNNLRSIRARVIKRTLDLAGAAAVGVLLLPVLLLIALAIRLDSPGPVIYRARRLGRDGRPFDCFKFRSMQRNAEGKLKEMLDANPALRAEFEATHKLKDDPRVTPVGAFLRKTSLDELPQLANVLLGSMSLVGPRPIVHAEVPRYGDIYAVYKQVRPGMTGYWQANGRSDTSYEERVGMDHFYVTNWSPWLDIVILLQTVRVVVRGKGAY
ncbi:undecaprenyl-phosphate galactosephosphotransferase [Deinococcus aerius]|uniref:Undecaprenyl-phosphate galactosephosphotransferase n=1 Tax=Deinococcus aerius TaxID=200253 RepID=A0A2I9CY25_9DEIO|nr:undecaprenyl-phosphate galactose phosphotransferase WbaP [Deinococcus aerius]GBF07022.1 undecaprenyl-phosphate galactosephosphotransferase [Deinococcus aerius]